jgi:nicotinate-nucleotide adenylyltransferase
VLLMTTGEAPHKSIDPEPGAEVRLEMTMLAVAAGGAQAAHVEASGLEVGREGPSYTYETLEQLSEREPDTELCFLMGADMAASLSSWEQPKRVLELARLGVVPREGVDEARVSSELEALGAADRARIIEMPLCGVSSTMIRERVAAGRPFRHLVPAGVGDLIEAKGLYR